MDEYLDFFDSIDAQLEIENPVLQIIQDKIEKNPQLKIAALSHLKNILNSQSAFKNLELEMWLKNFDLDHSIQSTLEDNGKYVIRKRPIEKIEPNSLRIVTGTCGVVQFRVPPNTIKKAKLNNKAVPSCFVITEKTFYNGINYIDIAFPVFENYFVNRGTKTKFLCVNEEIRKRIEVLATEEIFGPTLEQLKASGLTGEQAATLLKELQVFTVKVKSFDQERDTTLADYIETYSFKDNSIKLNEMEIIRQPGQEYFTVRENNKILGCIDLNKWEPVTIEEEFSLTEPGKETEFGVYFFDPSTGFDPARLTSSFIVWIGDGKGIVVDPLTNLPQYLDRKRINRNDIEYIFLTHVHSDHDDGILEQIISGKMIKLITSRIVMDSFVRKVKAITGWNDNQISRLISFQELKPGEEFKLNEKVTIRTDYAFHSIPTLRFVVTYTDPAKNLRKSIAHSGDTNYNKNVVEKIAAEKIITRQRADSILGFIWDSDLIIHDVGGGIHSDLKNLNELPEEIKKKVIAIHVHELPENMSIRQAHKGEEVTLVQTDMIQKYRRLTRQVDEITLFKRLSPEQKLDIIENSDKEQYKKDQVILKTGETAGKFYIIHSGEVEVVTPEGKKLYLGKGDYFGEMAFFTENKIRNATAYARTNVELLSLAEEKFGKYRNQILDTYNGIIENRPLLSQIPFFKMLSEREINALSSLFNQERFDKGDYIIRYGDMGNKFYIVKYGLLDVIVRDKENKPKTINQIGTGDPFGETALIEKTKRMADVVVASDHADIIMIDTDTFDRILAEYPGIYIGLEEIRRTYQNITKERL
ncbi:MAG: cyclic nucleotide-binding domain-containing protein [bacterium]|nr:cyclic nucleotide-binding domain-containing protein [bacterium]